MEMCLSKDRKSSERCRQKARELYLIPQEGVSGSSDAVRRTVVNTDYDTFESNNNSEDILPPNLINFGKSKFSEDVKGTDSLNGHERLPGQHYEILLKNTGRSVSFSGFGLFSRPSFSSLQSSLYYMSNEELDKMVDESKQEPSTSSTDEIRKYADKYKHLNNENLEEKNPWYKDMMELTHPAHFITVLAIIYLTVMLFPDSRISQSKVSLSTSAVYILSISAIFGAQIWMSFVSGIALYFKIPRHVFGKVQMILFPLYFLFNSILMLVVIVAYTQHHPTHLWDAHQMFQGVMLVVSFVINLGIRLYLSPVMVKLVTIKMAIESETGLGKSVGSSQPGILSRCPHYMRIYRAFRKLHKITAVGNIISVVATLFHLYYLATKLCVIQ